MVLKKIYDRARDYFCLQQVFLQNQSKRLKLVSVLFRKATGLLVERCFSMIVENNCVEMEGFLLLLAAMSEKTSPVVRFLRRDVNKCVTSVCDTHYFAVIESGPRFRNNGDSLSSLIILLKTLVYCF